MAKPAPIPPAGLPPWLGTFADMMTLLMAFFVLLLSLAEVDASKYRAVAGEMKKALGVKEDSSEINQAQGTTLSDEVLKAELFHADLSDKEKDAGDGSGAPQAKAAEEKESDPAEKKSEAEEKLDATFELLKEELAGLANAEKVFIAKHPGKVMIRIQEQGVFPSGSDKIQPQFLPVIDKLREVLGKTEGGIRVAGHTDDVPIANGRFRSNWELSSARAVSVLHEVLGNKAIDPARASAVGFGDSRPLVPNEDAASRAMNRRVEIQLTPIAD